MNFILLVASAADLPLLTSPAAPQRRPHQRTHQSLELHPAHGLAFAPNRKSRKRLRRPVRQVRLDRPAPRRAARARGKIAESWLI
jgi:hypothetical protein